MWETLDPSGNKQNPAYGAYILEETVSWTLVGITANTPDNHLR